MAAISLSGIEKTYGALKVVHGLDLEIADGEFVVLVGPSGCGKSTLLRMIAGLEEISGGVLRIGGQIANAAAPAERNVAMVFQDYALYPHMTVAENIGFGLKMRDHPADEIARAVDGAARTLKVAPYLDRRPAELSGGQRQRVAMGRAIVRRPEVFLFDEPLSNLDAALRGDMRIEIARLHRSMKATTVYVTHDQVEAMTLAERIVVMNQGRVEQVGSPMDLYEQPATLFVAQFIGAPMMNAVPATLCPWLALPEGAVTVGIRPEDLHPAPIGSDTFSGEVAVLERLGSQTFGHVDIAADRLLTVEWPKGQGLPAVGDVVGLRPGEGRVHAFDATGRRCGGPSTPAGRVSTSP